MSQSAFSICFSLAVATGLWKWLTVGFDDASSVFAIALLFYGVYNAREKSTTAGIRKDTDDRV